MYTRTYQAEEEKITVPENYDGNAFREEPAIAPDTPEEEVSVFLQAEESKNLSFTQETPTPQKKPESEEVSAKPKGESGILSGLFKRGRVFPIFENIPFLKNGFSDIGTEEILIVAVAIFLLFSKSGDKECAIMLLLLLFVK